MEICQPGPPDGAPGALRRAGAGFSRFGRCGPAWEGRLWSCTVTPAGPYIAALVFARGPLRQVATRIYFAVENVAEDRRYTLVAEPHGDRSRRFDVHHQGERETVFLEL